MKKKKQYSLTAKQRKEQRKGAEKRPEQMTDDERAAFEAEAQAKKQKRKKLFIFTAAALAAVLAITAIGFGVAMAFGAFDKKYNNEKVNPYAHIKLKSGDTIDIELFWNNPDKTPNVDMRPTIANLIFLGEKGFFDDTQFISSDYGYLVMAGFTSVTEEKAEHRAQDQSFLAKIESSFSSTYPRSNTWNPNSSTVPTGGFRLGYRIPHKTGTANTEAAKNPEGMIAFMAGYNVSENYATSTSFVLFGSNNKKFPLGNEKLNFFGRFTEQSLVTVKALTEKTQGAALKGTDDNWCAFEDSVIKSVTFSKLNKKLKGKIVGNFEEYVLWGTEGTLGYGNYWVGPETSWRSNPGLYVQDAVK